MATKLNQILAIEKGVKSRVYATFTELHKATQKATLLNGFHKTYQPKGEDGERYPAESQKVRVNHVEVFKQVARGLTELFDITATKDWTNCKARADIVVDGEILLTDVPATYLLFLEKQLSDLHAFVSKFVELDSGEDWNLDSSTGLHKTESIQTHRTKKVQRPIVLYDATEHHPAQTQLITEDVVVGYWSTVKMSGAIQAPRKRGLLDRIDRLTRAVKYAREQANAIEADRQHPGRKVFDFLFSE